MDNESKPPEAQQPKPKKGLHGGLAFVLFFPVGMVAGVGLIFAEAFAQSVKYSDLATVGCVLVAVVLAIVRRWGLAGFVLGMSVPLSAMALLWAICGK